VRAGSSEAAQATAASVTAPIKRRASGSTGRRSIRPACIAASSAAGVIAPKWRMSISRQRSHPSTAGPSFRMIRLKAGSAQAVK
jgi:hypothetical protein